LSRGGWPISVPGTSARSSSLSEWHAGLYETARAGPDEIFAARGDESLAHKVGVGGRLILEESPLHGALVGSLRHIDGPSIEGIDAAPPHGGGQGSRRRVEILGLVGDKAGVAQVFGELDRFRQARAGMGGEKYERIFFPSLASR